MAAQDPTKVSFANKTQAKPYDPAKFNAQDANEIKNAVNALTTQVNTAGQLVKLNAQGQLPAVDGSLLTNLPTSEASVADGSVTETKLDSTVVTKLNFEETWSDTQFEKVNGINQIKETYLIALIQANSSGSGTNAAPTVSGVAISGTPTQGQTLTGTYTYADAESNPQGASIKQWYRSDNTSALNRTAISGATNTTYILQAADVGKYIQYAVTPVATAGTTTGTQVFSSYSAIIASSAAPAGPYLLAVDGNSLIAGFNANGNGASDAVSSKTDTSKNDPVNYLRQDSAFASGWTLRNYGISGRQTTDSIIQASSANWVDADYSGVNYSKNILLFSEITNDIANTPNHTEEQAFQNIRTYCLARRAVGFVVGVTNMLPRTSFLEGYSAGASALETIRLSINARLAVEYPTFADALIDIASLNLILPDGTHANAAGYQSMAINRFKPTALALAQGTTAYTGGNYTPAAPSGLTIDDTNNTFDWTNAVGYINPMYYEYSMDSGSTYITCTAKPQTGVTGASAVGAFRLRVKATTGRNVSAAITNTTAFTGTATVANMFTNSNLATGWFAQSGGITTNDPQTSPDGTSPSGYPVTQSNGTTGRQGIKPPSDPTLTGGTQYTLSIHAKPYAGDQNWLYLKFWDGTQDRFAWFDVLNGITGSTSGTGITRGIAAAGNGYYRCYMTITAAGNGDTYFGLANADGASSITGDVTKKAVMYGPMLNVGGLATYTKTPTA